MAELREGLLASCVLAAGDGGDSSLQAVQVKGVQACSTGAVQVQYRSSTSHVQRVAGGSSGMLESLPGSITCRLLKRIPCPAVCLWWYINKAQLTSSTTSLQLGDIHWQHKSQQATCVRSSAHAQSACMWQWQSTAQTPLLLPVLLFLLQRAISSCRQADAGAGRQAGNQAWPWHLHHPSPPCPSCWLSPD